MLHIRHIKLLGILLTLMVVYTGCQDDYYDDGNTKLSLEARYLKVTENSFTISSDGQSCYPDYFAVNSVETAWKVSGTPDWLKLNGKSNLIAITGSESQKVTVRADENKIAESRTALFKVVSDESDYDYEMSMSATQNGAVPYLSPSETQLDFSGKGGVALVSIETNAKWECSDYPSWTDVIVNQSAKSVEIHANPNTGSSRKGYIYLRYYDANGNRKSVSIVVNQSAANISGSECSLSFGMDASSAKLEVESEVDWYVNNRYDWISVTPENGKAGKTSVTVEAAPNVSTSSRSGTIYFEVNYSIYHYLEIRQEGVYLKAPQSIELLSTANTVYVGIKSNYEWEVIECPDWLSIDTMSGKGDVSLSVTAEDNESIYARSGNIKIKTPGLNNTVTVLAKQAGKYAETDETVLCFDDKAGIRILKLTTDAQWSSACDCDWIHVSPESGTGDAEITVSVDENTGKSERYGNITYSWLDQTTQVHVSQTGKYLNVDSGELDFGSHGGTHNVSVATTDKWTASFDEPVDWITLSQESGDGDAEFTFTVADNPHTKGREAVIVVKTDFDEGYRLHVKQQPRYLHVSAAALTFYGRGGTSDLVTIETDGQLSVTSEESWITIQNEDQDGSMFFVTVPSNETGLIRTGSIRIALTDLVDEEYVLEIPVVQHCVGGSYVAEPYTEDVDWNATGSSGFTVKVTSFSTDKNWNQAIKAGITVKSTAFGQDGDLNGSGAGTGTISGTGHGSDTDLNGVGTGDTDITGKGYGNDTDLNGAGTDDTDITGKGYGNDKDLNGAGKGDADITGKGYGDDKNLDGNGTGSGDTDITGTGHGDDKNLDGNGTSDSNITGKEHGDDKNLDGNGTSDSSIKGSGYGTDKDLDKAETESQTTRATSPAKTNEKGKRKKKKGRSNKL